MYHLDCQKKQEKLEGKPSFPPIQNTVDSGNSKRLNSKQSLISKHFW